MGGCIGVEEDWCTGSGGKTVTIWGGKRAEKNCCIGKTKVTVVGGVE